MPVSVNLRDVLAVCVNSALATQQYIALDLLKLSKWRPNGDSGGASSSLLELNDTEKQELLRSLQESVTVDVKSELAYKDGEASHDLVTTADVLTQAVVVKALTTAFADLPFTIVGEEEADAAEKDPVMAAKVKHCFDAYYNARGSIPCEQQFAQHVAQQPSVEGKGVVTADSLDALRERVSLYIDPIDGTNCFVTGVWQSPMTLIGITVDGQPLAAVMNRVFLYPIGTQAATQPTSGGISYVWNPTPDVGGSSFMVHEGAQVPLHATPCHPPAPELMSNETVLRVTQSSTTKASFLDDVASRLKPSETVLARGAGNKLFTLIEKTLARSYGVEPHRHGEPVHADVFICPGHTIKKWDTCAPHAFLFALHGEVFSHRGVPLRYQCKRTDDPHSAAFTDLPDGIVATRKEAKEVVMHRLGWSH